jgi:hypothetical protein
MRNLGSFRQWDLFHKSVIEQLTEVVGSIEVRLGIQPRVGWPE